MLVPIEVEGAEPEFDVGSVGGRGVGLDLGFGSAGFDVRGARVLAMRHLAFKAAQEVRPSLKKTVNESYQ